METIREHHGLYYSTPGQAKIEVKTGFLATLFPQVAGRFRPTTTPAKPALPNPTSWARSAEKTCRRKASLTVPSAQGKSCRNVATTPERQTSNATTSHAPNAQRDHIAQAKRQRSWARAPIKTLERQTPSKPASHAPNPTAAECGPTAKTSGRRFKVYRIPSVRSQFSIIGCSRWPRSSLMPGSPA